MQFRIPKLLPDEPAVVDSFGAHERIAGTLATLIETSEGGKSIRLDGAWGAGKSTVVQILRKLLAEKHASMKGGNSAPLVFLYDAWVHSGDGLRRAFLEELARNLLEQGWIAAQSPLGKRWQQKLSTIAGKRKQVTKITNPQLTWRARVAIAFSVTGALMAPAVYKLLSLIFGDWTTPELSWLTACAAVGLFALTYAISAADLRVLLTRSTLEEMTETLSDSEPTSIEFQQAFDELMSDFLTTGRKLVVVIDNLDRIDSDEAKQVWTLLRSFLDNPTFRKKQWFERLWLLVPVADEVRLLGLSQTGDYEIQAPQGNILEKVFQVRMSLPLPMLRPWKQFLTEKLSHCFGPDEERSHEVIARLLHAFASNSAPTPREIVVFVNELVALYIERHGDMSLATLAAYILARRQTKMRAWQVPHDIAQVYFTPTLEQDFATLYLHAEKSKESLYLLVTPNLERALEKGSPRELHDVLDSSPASLDVLEQLLIQFFSRLSQMPGTQTPEQDRFFAYLRALRLFTDAELGGQSSSGFLSHIRPRIDSVMQMTTALNLANPNVAEGVAAYIDLATAQESAVAKVVYLLATLEPYKEVENAANVGAWQVWSTSLIEVLSIPQVRAATTDLDAQRIPLRVSAERWATFCSKVAAEPSNRFVLDVTDISTPDGELSDWTVNELIPTNADRRGEIVLRQGISSRGDAFFNLVAEKVATVFQARSDLPAAMVLDCLTCLIAVSGEGARAFVKRLAEAGMFSLWAALGQPPNSLTLNEDFVRFAVLYLWAMRELPPMHPNTMAMSVGGLIAQFFQGNTPSGEPLINACNQLILKAHIFDVLPTIASISANNHSVLTKVLSGLCAAADFLETARAELSGETSSSGPKLVSGPQPEVMRSLLSQVIANIRVQGSEVLSQAKE